MASKILIIASMFLLLTTMISTSEKTDKVKKLPGQRATINFNQFAGYISVDQVQDRALFYYFVEAEVDPASKPVVLWLNGGPGCSSVGIGAFEEHGPFKATMKGLVKNEYSWNKEANMLYLDTPAGVGFSYSANTSFYFMVTDEISARDNLVFLEHWFAKFPAYRSNDFIIAGESYAGHFAPQLANLILKTKTTINLKGIALGNPLLEFNTDFNSASEFLWSHGQISDSTYEGLKTVCSFATIKRQSRSASLSTKCDEVSRIASIEASYTDLFDVLDDICSTPASQQAYVLNQQQAGETKCAYVEDGISSYLNRKQVQKALHAKLVGVNKWSPCSGVLLYDFENLEIPTISLLGTLVESGVRVLAFSGDQDSVIPLTGTRSLINGLAKDLGLSKTESYRPWFNGREVAGWTQEYGRILTFATIKGAGHAASYAQPGRSLVMLKAFLEGKSLPNYNSSM